MLLLLPLVIFTLLSQSLGKPNIPLREAKLAPRSPTAHRGYSQATKASLYMMNLYRSIVMGNDTRLPAIKRQLIQESNSVISFVPKDCIQRKNSWRFIFDMKPIATDTEIRLAELRIPNPSFHHAKLNIYNVKDNKEFFLGSLNPSSPHTLEPSWKVFNVTQMLVDNLHGAEVNTIRRDAKVKDTPNRDQEDNCNEDVAQRVALIVFAKERPSPASEGLASLIKAARFSKLSESENNGKRKPANKRKARSVGSHHVPATEGTPQCRKVDMFVEFPKFGWGHQIIAPRRYNAFRCDGACTLPLNKDFKESNQNFLKLNVSESMGCSPCQPVKLRALSMLQLVDGRVVLNREEDMVVEECGWR
ncbi:nodal homolog 2-A-like [Pelodytes ibericus]